MMQTLKGILTAVMALVMLCSLLPVSVLAVEEVYPTSGQCGKNVTWEFDEATGTLTISGNGNIEDYDKISPWAGLNVKSVVIDENINRIGAYAFAQCSQIEKVTLMVSNYSFSGVAYIGDYAFEGCIALKEIEFPYDLHSIGVGSFRGCSSLKKISLPRAWVTSIPNESFKDCSSLEEVIIYTKVKSIGNDAYAGCERLKSIFYGGEADAWENIRKGDNAIPDTTNIYYGKGNHLSSTDGLFRGTCGENLTWVFDDSTDHLIISGTGDMNDSYMYSRWSGLEIKSVVICEGVTSIGEYTFYECDTMESITLPKSLTSIGGKAFKGCKSLKSIDIPDGVYTINSSTFYECVSMSEVSLPQTLTTIEYAAFLNCFALEEIEIPTSVLELESSCFSGCSSLKQIHYASDQVTWLKIEIGHNAIPDNAVVIYKVKNTGVCADGHVVVELESVRATCVNDGKTNGRYCSVCNMVFKAQEVIPATGEHDYSQGTCRICGQAAPINGKCGENLFWDYDRGSATLRIAGKGEMYDYLLDSTPWRYVPSYLLRLAIKEGVETISSNAFSGSLFDHLDIVDLPKSLKSIGKYGLGNISTGELVLRSDIQQNESHYSEAGLNWIGMLYVEEGVTSVPADIAGAARYMELPVSLQTLYNSSYDDQIIYYNGTEEQWKQVQCFNLGESVEYSCKAYSVIGCDGNGYVNQSGYMHLYNIGSNWHKKYMVNVIEATLGTPEFESSSTAILNSDSGFANFGNLKVLTIYPCMKTILESAFLNCYSLKEIYFAGTEEEWNKLLFHDGSNALRNVTVYYNHGEHTWEENEVIKNATCTEAGERTVICTGCGKTSTEKILPVGHNYEKGYCSVCNAVDPDYVDPSWPFADVRDRDWFIQPVLWAKEENITGGISENQFGPNESCTRAQVVTFLWAANGKPEPKSMDNPFSDVADDAWYLKPVLWAVEQGITGGVAEGKFGPNNTCTRAQIATFLYAAKGKPAVSGKSIFKDVADDAWFAKPVIWAAENEVTGGIGDGKFGPNNTCTRAQVVTFLYKVYGLQ